MVMGVRRVELLLVVVCLGGVCLAEYTRTTSYEGEVLIKCSGLKREVVQSLLEGDGVDVWHVGAGGTVDFRISNEEFLEMKGDLPECRVERSVEELVREMEAEIHKESLNKTQLDWFQEYHDYNETVRWYEDFAKNNTDLVKFVPSIGKSLEGRDMPALHITATEGGEDVNKIYLQCQIHGREWISSAVCMYIAYYMVTWFGVEHRLSDLLLSAELVIIAFMNPDGYEYTWVKDRLWSKNRRPASTSDCFGVDLNRNYPYKWGESGSSDDPCSETYHGTGPGSEPETQHSMNYFRAHGPVVGAMDWQSYGQLIVRPYGWTKAIPIDDTRMMESGENMSSAIFVMEGTYYASLNAFDLYQTSGTARDWFYSDEASELSKYRSAGYSIQLRDTGKYGFLLPPGQIIPAGNEIVPAVIVLGEELNKNPILK